MIDVGGTPVIASGGDGMGGGMGIWAILLLALLGGNGFGGGARGETDIINDNINSRFSSLEGMNESRFMAQANNIAHIEALEATRDNQDAICTTQRMILEQGQATTLLAKNSEIEALKCCCETQTQMAAGFNALAQKMDANEIQTLRDRVTALQLDQSQCAQNAYLTQALRPYPVPAFGSCNPGLAGGCGCGNGF